MTLTQYHNSMIELINDALKKKTVQAIEYAPDDIRFIQTSMPGFTIGHLRQDNKGKKWRLGILLPVKNDNDKAIEEFEVSLDFVTVVKNYVEETKKKETEASQVSEEQQIKILEGLKGRLFE